MLGGWGGVCLVGSVAFDTAALSRRHIPICPAAFLLSGSRWLICGWPAFGTEVGDPFTLSPQTLSTLCGADRRGEGREWRWWGEGSLNKWEGWDWYLISDGIRRVSSAAAPMTVGANEARRGKWEKRDSKTLSGPPAGSLRDPPCALSADYTCGPTSPAPPTDTDVNAGVFFLVKITGFTLGSKVAATDAVVDRKPEQQPVVTLYV